MGGRLALCCVAGLTLAAVVSCSGQDTGNGLRQALAAGDLNTAISALDKAVEEGLSGKPLVEMAHELSEALIRRMAVAGPRVAPALAIDPLNPVQRGKAARIQNMADVLAWTLDLAGARSVQDNILMAAEGESAVKFTRSTLDAAFCGNVAVADLNADGRPDLLADGARLFLNRGNGVLAQDHGRMGDCPDGMKPHAGLVVDVNGDGRPDILQLAGMRLRLLLQDDNGYFRDATRGSGLEEPFIARVEGAAFADVDVDGRPDLYVAGYESDAGPGPDRLYRNLGNGRFADETALRGLELDKPRQGRAVTFGDMDADGWPDLFVGNYRLQPNSLWCNKKGHFSDRATETGIKGEGRKASFLPEGDPDQKYWGHTIGGAFGDVDNDLDLDLLVGNLAHPDFISFSDPSQLFLNPGDAGTWRDVFSSSGLRFAETHSDASFADVDNDGDLDVFFTAVYPHRPTRLWLSHLAESGTLSFDEATWRAGTLAFDTWGHAWFDAEGDGDLDLALAGRHGGLYLFLNGGAPAHSWCRVCPEPALPGTRVTVKAGNKVQIREIAVGRGISSQDEAVAHVGLGTQAGKFLEITVRWPDGATVHTTSPPNVMVTVRR